MRSRFVSPRIDALDALFVQQVSLANQHIMIIDASANATTGDTIEFTRLHKLQLIRLRSANDRLSQRMLALCFDSRS